jgi:D-alanine-D-alanine ligase
MMKQRRVGVLMGAWGEQRETSIEMGQAIAAALEARGYDVTRIVAGPGLDQSLRETGVEVAFLALRGRVGDDGQVQGLLEVMGIPFTGSGVLASALAMNKSFAKKLFRQHNIATPAGHSVSAAQLDRLPELHGDLGFPCVVKPASGGSPRGAMLVRDGERLDAAVRVACRFGDEALVERYVSGHQVTVAIVGGRVLGACEVSSGAMEDDGPAPNTGKTEISPARLPTIQVANLTTLAVKAYRALGCRGAALVDFMCPDVGNEVLLQVNPVPEMHPDAVLPQIADAGGVSFEDLCEMVLQHAELPTVERPLSVARTSPDFTEHL